MGLSSSLAARPFLRTRLSRRVRTSAGRSVSEDDSLFHATMMYTLSSIHCSDRHSNVGFAKTSPPSLYCFPTCPELSLSPS